MAEYQPYQEQQLLKSNQAYNQGGLGGAYMDMQSNDLQLAGPLNKVLSNSEWGRKILDPIDLFGSRAALDQANLDTMARNSAGKSINAMYDQYNTTLGLQQPFLDLGQQGLGQMGQYTQGQNFDTMLNEGSRQLRGSANASGLGNSSAAGRNMAGFVNNLTQEDMNRQYQQALRNIQIGQGAVGTMGQAASGLGSGASNIYGNWGQQSAQNALGYGQQRQDSLTSAGNALAGAGQYFGSK